MNVSEKKKEIEIGRNKYFYCLLKNCQEEIASSDSLRITIDIQEGTPRESVERVITELGLYGWKAKRVQGSDQRDGDKWDYLEVTG